jgi:hypothetical protein
MRFAQCAAGRRHRVIVRVGDPVPIIIEQAHELDAELLALSWRGTLKGDRAPVIRAMFEQSPCPLLLVPAARAEWCPRATGARLGRSPPAPQPLGPRPARRRSVMRRSGTRLGRPAPEREDQDGADDGARRSRPTAPA